VILSLVSSAIRCVFISLLSQIRLYQRYLFSSGSGKCPLQTPALTLTKLIAVYRGFLRRARQTQDQRPTLNQTSFLLHPYPVFLSPIISSSWRLFSRKCRQNAISIVQVLLDNLICWNFITSTSATCTVMFYTNQFHCH